MFKLLLGLGNLGMRGENLRWSEFLLEIANTVVGNELATFFGLLLFVKFLRPGNCWTEKILAVCGYSPFGICFRFVVSTVESLSARWCNRAFEVQKSLCCRRDVCSGFEEAQSSLCRGIAWIPRLSFFVLLRSDGLVVASCFVVCRKYFESKKEGWNVQ